MRLVRMLSAVAGLALSVAIARAADPVTVSLNATASVGKSVVTLGDVALISGGDADVRARVGRIDLAELKSRSPSTIVGRKSVEYRLLLAGFDASTVRVTGAERSTVTLSRRAVTVEEVTAVARTELLRQYSNAEAVVVELAVPVVVRLPEVPADEQPTITAKSRGKPGATGRVQVDVTVTAGGEQLLSFAIHLNVQPAGPTAARPAVAPAGGVAPLAPIAPPSPIAPAAPVGGEMLVRPRQRVEIQVNTGGIKASVLGEAQQGGKLGQTILVQNVDSKKTISARVTGPGTVEVDLGGAR